MAKSSGYPEKTTPAAADFLLGYDLTTGTIRMKIQSLRAIFSAKRVTSVGSTASVAVNGDTTDFYTVTALTANTTIAAPTGTPADGQVITVRIKDDGTSRTIAFAGIWRAIGVTLPTATVAGQVMYMSAIYNGQDGTWDVVSIGRQ